jgi:pilus assembly protein Flp/PilA
MENLVFGKVESNFWKFSSIKFKKPVAQKNDPWVDKKDKVGPAPNPASNEKGQGLVEYMVLVALITAGTIGVIRVVSYNIGIQYENINRALGAKASNQLQAVSAEQSILNKKDLSNFLNGVK